MPCFLATLMKINKTIHRIKAPAFPTFAYVYKSIFKKKEFHAKWNFVLSSLAVHVSIT